MIRGLSPEIARVRKQLTKDWVNSTHNFLETLLEASEKLPSNHPRVKELKSVASKTKDLFARKKTVEEYSEADLENLYREYEIVHGFVTEFYNNPSLSPAQRKFFTMASNVCGHLTWAKQLPRLIIDVVKSLVADEISSHHTAEEKSNFILQVVSKTLGVFTSLSGLSKVSAIVGKRLRTGVAKTVEDITANNIVATFSAEYKLSTMRNFVASMGEEYTLGDEIEETPPASLYNFSETAYMTGDTTEQANSISGSQLTKQIFKELTETGALAKLAKEHAPKGLNESTVDSINEILVTLNSDNEQNKKASTILKYLLETVSQTTNLNRHPILQSKLSLCLSTFTSELMSKKGKLDTESLSRIADSSEIFFNEYSNAYPDYTYARYAKLACIAAKAYTRSKSKSSAAITALVDTSMDVLSDKLSTAESGVFYYGKRTVEAGTYITNTINIFTPYIIRSTAGSIGSTLAGWAGYSQEVKLTRPILLTVEKQAIVLHLNIAELTIDNIKETAEKIVLADMKLSLVAQKEYFLGYTPEVEKYNSILENLDKYETIEELEDIIRSELDMDAEHILLLITQDIHKIEDYLQYSYNNAAELSKIADAKAANQLLLSTSKGDVIDKDFLSNLDEKLLTTTGEIDATSEALEQAEEHLKLLSSSSPSLKNLEHIRKSEIAEQKDKIREEYRLERETTKILGSKKERELSLEKDFDVSELRESFVMSVDKCRRIRVFNSMLDLTKNLLKIQKLSCIDKSDSDEILIKNKLLVSKNPDFINNVAESLGFDSTEDLLNPDIVKQKRIEFTKPKRFKDQDDDSITEPDGYTKVKSAVMTEFARLSQLTEEDTFKDSEDYISLINGALTIIENVQATHLITGVIENILRQYVPGIDINELAKTEGAREAFSIILRNIAQQYVDGASHQPAYALQKNIKDTLASLRVNVKKKYSLDTNDLDIVEGIDTLRGELDTELHSLNRKIEDKYKELDKISDKVDMASEKLLIAQNTLNAETSKSNIRDRKDVPKLIAVVQIAEEVLLPLSEEKDAILSELSDLQVTKAGYESAIERFGSEEIQSNPNSHTAKYKEVEKKASDNKSIIKEIEEEAKDIFRRREYDTSEKSSTMPGSELYNYLLQKNLSDLEAINHEKAVSICFKSLRTTLQYKSEDNSAKLRLLENSMNNSKELESSLNTRVDKHIKVLLDEYLFTLAEKNSESFEEQMSGDYNPHLKTEFQEEKNIFIIEKLIKQLTKNREEIESLSEANPVVKESVLRQIINSTQELQNNLSEAKTRLVWSTELNTSLIKDVDTPVGKSKDYYVNEDIKSLTNKIALYRAKIASIKNYIASDLPKLIDSKEKSYKSNYCEELLAELNNLIILEEKLLKEKVEQFKFKDRIVKIAKQHENRVLRDIIEGYNLLNFKPSISKPGVSTTPEQELEKAIEDNIQLKSKKNLTKTEMDILSISAAQIEYLSTHSNVFKSAEYTEFMQGLVMRLILENQEIKDEEQNTQRINLSKKIALKLNEIMKTDQHTVDSSLEQKMSKHIENANAKVILTNVGGRESSLSKNITASYHAYIDLSSIEKGEILPDEQEIINLNARRIAMLELDNQDTAASYLYVLTNKHIGELEKFLHSNKEEGDNLPQNYARLKFLYSSIEALVERKNTYKGVEADQIQKKINTLRNQVDAIYPTPQPPVIMEPSKAISDAKLYATTQLGANLYKKELEKLPVLKRIFTKFLNLFRSTVRIKQRLIDNKKELLNSKPESTDYLDDSNNSSLTLSRSPTANQKGNTPRLRQRRSRTTGPRRQS